MTAVALEILEEMSTQSVLVLGAVGGPGCGIDRCDHCAACGA